MIKSLTLQNYKGFRNATIEFSDITCIIGENSTGKSTIIQAIQDLLTSGNPIPQESCKVGINDFNTTSLSLDFQDGKKMSKNIQKREYDDANRLPVLITDIEPINLTCTFSLENQNTGKLPIKNQGISDKAWQNILNQCDFTLEVAAERTTTISDSIIFQETYLKDISEKFTNSFNNVLENSIGRKYQFQVLFERNGNQLLAKLYHSYEESDSISYKKSPSVNLDYESEGFRTLIALCSYLFNDQDKSEKIFVMDEPFTNIHPKAQRQVSRMLESLSQRFQIIYATHSPHLLPERDKVRCTLAEVAGDLSTCKFEEYPLNRFYDLSPLALDTVEEIKRSDTAINVCVEGKTDGKIYEKFFELENISGMIDITNVNGVGNMKMFIKALAGINKPSLFIVDPREDRKQIKGCRQDIEKHDNLFLLELPYEENNHVKKGIENLMPNHIIQKAFQAKIGKIEKLTRETYGETPVEEYETNHKEALAEFFVNEAARADYQFFDPVIKRINEIREEFGI